MRQTDKYKYQNKKSVERQAKHLSDNCADMDLCIHKINKFLIFKFLSFEVVNSEKLTIDCFETESEALNFCLDRFSGSKIPEQKDFEFNSFTLKQ
jgi:hypothetical protein